MKTECYFSCNYHHHHHIHHSLLFLFRWILIWICFHPIISVSSDELDYRVTWPPTLRCSNESRDVNACWNKYMEMDFMQLNSIMYPKDSRANGDCRFRSTRQRERTGHELYGTSPVFFENCQKLHGIYDCLDEELKHCDELYNFFNLRHLLYTLKKIILWLCGQPALGSETSDDNTHDEIKTRFLVLLRSAQCLECFRTSNTSPCHQKENKLIGDSHLWLKILRLQVGPEICSQLKMQFQCFKNRNLQSECDIQNNVHTNLTEMFIQTWCDQHPFLPPPNSSANSNSRFHKHTLLSSSSSQSLALVFLLILFNYWSTSSL